MPDFQRSLVHQATATLFCRTSSNINRYVIIRGHLALEANGFWKNFKHFNNDFPPSCSHVHNVMSYQGYFFPRCSSAQTPVGAAASPPLSAVVKVIFFRCFHISQFTKRCIALACLRLDEMLKITRHDLYKLSLILLSQVQRHSPACSSPRSL